MHGPLVRVLLVDADPAFRAAVAQILAAARRTELVGWACDAPEAVRTYRALRPDVVLLGEAIAAAPAILGLDPDARILTLTAGGAGPRVRGAHGALKKDAVALVPVLLQLSSGGGSRAGR